MYFVILSYAMYLYHTFLPLASTFISVLQIFTEIGFLFLNCSTVSFSMEVMTGYLQKFPWRCEGGGKIGKGTYAMRGRKKRTRAFDGGRWSNFCHFGAYLLIE